MKQITIVIKCPENHVKTIKDFVQDWFIGMIPVEVLGIDVTDIEEK